MLPDRVSNRGPLTYESGALPIALHGPAATEYRPPVYKDNAFSSPRVDFVECVVMYGNTMLLAFSL